MAAEDGLSFLTVGKMGDLEKMFSVTSTSLCICSRRKRKTACLEESRKRKLCLISLGNPLCYFFWCCWLLYQKKPFNSILLKMIEAISASCHRCAIFNIPFPFHCYFSYLFTVSINFVLNFCYIDHI